MPQTQEIGALIVALRTESAQFRAEMDKVKGSVKGVGEHAALSARSMARFAAIGAEQLFPALQGSRVAIESLAVALSNAKNAFLAMLLPIGKIVGVFAAGFFLGNVIRNFTELVVAGHGWTESLRLAVGITKDYETSTKDALEAQKKFSAEQQAHRAVISGLDKELASLQEDYRKLAELAERERAARIITLPLVQREAAERKSAAITELELLTERHKKELEIKEAREKQQERGLKAATDLGIPATGLIQGLADIETLQKDIDALGQEFTRLTAKGIPARDLFTEIAGAQGKIDERIESLKDKFKDVPIVFQRLQDLQRSVGGGEFARGLDGTVRGIQHLAEGSADVEDAMGNLVDTTLGKAKQGFGEVETAAGQLATTMAETLPSAFAGLDSGFVVVTGRLRDLAESFAAASREALFFETVVGAGGNVAVAGPGNF